MSIAKQTKINYEELIKSVQQDPKALAKSTEQKYKKSLQSVAKEIAKDFEHNRIVLVTGPSGSGKTTTSNLLAEELRKRSLNSIVISMDDFYKSVSDRELVNGKVDYESVNALDLTLFKKCINNLLTKNKSVMPSYDFKTSILDKKAYTLKLEKNTVIIIEGIHAFNPKVLSDKMQDKVFRLYVHTNTFFFSEFKVITPAMIRFFRRVIRDYHHRGASVERTQKMWRDVIEGEKKYIVPFRDLADKCIDTTHIYEPFLYLEEVSNISKDDTNASIYLTIFESDIIFDRANLSEDSLIWEFVG